jgi:hypothetical protein
VPHWPDPNERGKLECPDCASEFTNPIGFLKHFCYPDRRDQIALATIGREVKNAPRELPKETEAVARRSQSDARANRG